MKHRIVISFQTEHRFRRLPTMMHVKKCIEATLAAERVPVPCEINVLITDDQTIRTADRPLDGRPVLPDVSV